MADIFRPMGTVTAFKDIGIPPSTRPHGISCQSFLVCPLDLHMRITIAFLDFLTFGPLILRMRLGIKFLFVIRYPFFSPAPHDINLGSRFRVRRQLRPGGLSPQTDGMPGTLKKRETRSSLFPFLSPCPSFTARACADNAMRSERRSHRRCRRSPPDADPSRYSRPHRKCPGSKFPCSG